MNQRRDRSRPTGRAHDDAPTTAHGAPSHPRAPSGFVDFAGIRFPITAATPEIMAEFRTIGACGDGETGPAVQSTSEGLVDHALVRGPQLSVTIVDGAYITSVDETGASEILATPRGEDPARRYGAPIPVGGTYSTVSAAVHAALSVMTERSVRLEPDQLHLHAGAAVIDGKGIVIPAESGVGKTTLVAELGYFGGVITDELVTVDRHAGVLRAPRRPLAIKSTGFSRTADRHPDLFAPDPGEFVWHLDLASIGVPHIATASPAAIVLPHRRPGPVKIEAVAPGAALLALIANSFDLDVDPARAFGDLAWLVGTSHCLRVTYSDAADVGAPLTAWLAAHRAPPAVAAAQATNDDGSVVIVRLDDTEVCWDTTTREVAWRATR